MLYTEQHIKHLKLHTHRNNLDRFTLLSKNKQKDSLGSVKNVCAIVTSVNVLSAHNLPSFNLLELIFVESFKSLFLHVEQNYHV